jgi:argininosuccinate lyase
MLATELADYLVTKGVPFREAHSITGQIVRFSLEQQRPLQQLTVQDLQGFSPRFGKDVLHCLTVRGAIDRKDQIGGTARRRVEARIKELEKALKG